MKMISLRTRAVIVTCGVASSLAAAIAAGTVARGDDARPANFVASPSPSPSTDVSSSPSVSPSASPSASAAPSEAPASARPTRKTAASTPRRTTAKPAAKAPARKTGPKTYYLSPVTALGSQATIDRGKLVTWMTSPTCLLAGHNTMGWSWIDDVPTGSFVVVKTGPCKGRYKIVTHRSQSTKGGPVPAWMSGYDLVLQTCRTRGMGFAAAQRA